MENLIQNLIDAISVGSLYTLLALGLAIVFSIMKLINLAYGDLIIVGGYMMVILANKSQPVIIVGVIMGVVIVTLGMERLAFRPVRQSSASTLMVTSFALSYLIQNLAILIFGGLPESVSFGSSLIEPLDIFGIRIARLSILVIVISIILLIALVLFFNKTNIGIQMKAAAEDFTMARLLGVKANSVIATAFALSGFLAAVVSFMYIIQIGIVKSTTGVDPLIIAIVATVIGGLGSLEGAALGGFIVGFLSIMIQAVLPTEVAVYRDAFLYLIVIMFILVKPKGLIPPKTTGRTV